MSRVKFIALQVVRALIVWGATLCWVLGKSTDKRPTTGLSQRIQAAHQHCLAVSQAVIMLLCHQQHCKRLHCVGHRRVCQNTLSHVMKEEESPMFLTGKRKGRIFPSNWTFISKLIMEWAFLAGTQIHFSIAGRVGSIKFLLMFVCIISFYALVRGLLFIWRRHKNRIDAAREEPLYFTTDSRHYLWGDEGRSKKLFGLCRNPKWIFETVELVENCTESTHWRWRTLVLHTKQ